MKPRVGELAERLTAILSAWKGVESICLNEAAAADTLDPYFALILDVYCTAPIPEAQERISLYPAHTLFETSPRETKDRFLVGELPVRIEYKNCERINQQIETAQTAGSDLWKIRDSGTYVFYRLTHCKPLFNRSSWHSGAVERLETLPDSFWLAMRAFYRSSMEHFLSDLGASLMQEDTFHYLVSSAGFIKSACSALFMENGCFEPSHRAYYHQTMELKTVPDDFAGRFESFLRPDSELPPARKYEIAKLIARSIALL